MLLEFMNNAITIYILKKIPHLLQFLSRVMTLSIISVKVLLWIIWMNVALFFPVHKQIQIFIETIITCKHLPNSKPILCYGLFISFFFFCLNSLWSDWSPHQHYFFSILQWKYLLKTCDLSIKVKKIHPCQIIYCICKYTCFCIWKEAGWTVIETKIL